MPAVAWERLGNHASAVRLPSAVIERLASAFSVETFRTSTCSGGPVALSLMAEAAAVCPSYPTDDRIL